MSAWNAPPPTYDAPSTSYMTTTLTPYLQLPHLLSLTWLAYPILSLMFVAFRLQLSLAASQDAVANAKDNLLTSCKAAERAATAAASMPRYMAIASNEQFADAVNASLGGARAALVLSLTIMEAVINFIIDLYRSTLLCFLELVVRGGLAILISAVQEVNQVIQSATSALRTSIQNDISSANNVIKSAIDGINKVNPFGDITAPQINVPSLDALNNVTLPPSFEQALTNLNASLPTVADIKDKVEDVINTPFELLKKDINDTFSGLSFNSSVLPIPEQNRLAFCNDLDMSIVDDVGRDLIKTAKIGVVILILLALLLIGLNCLLTWYKWRCMKSHLEYTREAWMTDPTMQHSKGVTAPQVSLTDHNLMMLQANSEHPLITRIVNQLSARLRLSPSQHTHMQWFLNYIFHAPAFAVFLIGFFGLLCIQIQLWAMNPLLAKYQDRASAATSDFSNTIATSINASMYNQSAAYANDVNGRVDAIQTTINQGVFGWVNGTTVTLNTTIVNFYSEVENAVATVFNGTILESPANEFLKCLLGTKVDAIESALTFLHDNLKIDMPRVNQTVLILSPESVNEATTPIAEAAIGGGNGDQGGLIVRLVNSYADSLKKERIMFGIFLGLWGLVVLMGIVVLLWHSYGRAWVEKRKRRKWETEQRSGIDGIVVPFRLGGNPGDEKGVGSNGNLSANGSSADLRAFTPMPSPKAGGFKPFNFAWSGNGSSSGEQARSTDNLNPPQEKTWDSFFGQKPETQNTVTPVSKSTKLMAIGRKALGKERFKGDKELRLVSEPPMMAEQGSYSAFEPQANNRNTAWYGRVATMLGGKKDNDSDSIDFNSNNAGRGRPSLRIEVDRPSDEFTRSDDPYAYDTRPNQSRWSSSPEATQTTVPWMNRISGSPKKTTASPPRPPIGLPIRLKQHKPAVPSDVGSTFDDSIDALPLPLHHGFENTTSSSRPNDAHTSPPPRMKSPLMYPQLSLAPPPRRTPPKPQGLAPPKDRHRRSSSVPSPTWSTSDSTISLTPVTRLLTTTHARQSSSALNPFVTPFDDEHRVQIDHPPAHAARKSIPTNPFIAL